MNNLNELSTVTRSGKLSVAGVTTTAAASVSVNTTNAFLYADHTFASTNHSLADGNNTFTVIATNAFGEADTNSFTVNLRANVAFIYDLNGNLRTNGTRFYDYDDENQLIAVTESNAWKSAFVYDGLNRRRVQKDYYWSSGWIQTNETRFIYDGNVILQERASNNTPLVTYTRGNDLSGSLQGAGGIGGLLARTEPDAATTQTAFYHCDGNGNIACLLNTNQLVVAKYLYDSFGNILAATGPLADANTMQFSSMPAHRSGLVLFVHRAYAPNLQRWLNQDPIAEAGGINLYRFVENNPIGSVDLFGESDFNRPSSDISQYWTMCPTDTQSIDYGNPSSTPDFNRNFYPSQFDPYFYPLPSLPYLDPLLSVNYPGWQFPIWDPGITDLSGDFFNTYLLGGLPGSADSLWAKLADTSAVKAGTMRNVVQFNGMEVRAVRNLSHVDDETLEAMQQYGFAGTTKSGDTIVLHHLEQNAAGPVVEMPSEFHSIGNEAQHPFGNTTGVGLSDAERAAFDGWRTEYWQWRATEELNARRVLGN